MGLLSMAHSAEDASSLPERDGTHWLSAVCSGAWPELVPASACMALWPVVARRTVPVSILCEAGRHLYALQHGTKCSRRKREGSKRKKKKPEEKQKGTAKRKVGVGTKRQQVMERGKKKRKTFCSCLHHLVSYGVLRKDTSPRPQALSSASAAWDTRQTLSPKRATH